MTNESALPDPTAGAAGGRLKVRVLMGDYPNTQALRSGRLGHPRIELDFCGENRPMLAFRRAVDGAFDVAELALTTFLQARAFGRPLQLMPAVMFGGKSQHAAIAYNAGRGQLAPRDLAGRRVGIRSDSQTTVMWVRGILQSDYGVDIDRVTWVTFEDAHVAEVRDPPNAVRAPAGKKLFDMLIDGEIDAAVLPPADLKDPRLRPLIPEADAAAAAWTARNGFFPINHVLTVSNAFADANAWALPEIFRLVAESRKSAPPPTAAGPDPYPLGVEAMRKALEAAIGHAVRQRLIARRFEVDELFCDGTRALR